MNWIQKISNDLYTLYHGTNKIFDSFDLSFAGARDWGDFGVGIYLSTRSSLACDYAWESVKHNGGNPVVYVIKANLSNVANFNELMKGIRSVGAPEEKDVSYMQSGLQTRPEIDSRAITEFMINHGFDSARVGEQVVVYDPSLLSIDRVISAEEAQLLP